MNHSLSSADRGTYRRIIMLGGAGAAVIVALSAHVRERDLLEASRSQPAVQRIAAPNLVRPLAVAELKSESLKR